MKPTNLLAGIATTVALGSIAAPAGAAIIDFEGVVPADGGVRIYPFSPRDVDGFEVTSSNDNINILGGANPFLQMIGDNTSWLEMNPNRTGALTPLNGAPFNVNKVYVGPTSQDGPNFKLTITGVTHVGIDITEIVSNLSTTKQIYLGWNNLDQIQFYSNATVGIDNITISTIPEAPTWAMMLVGFGSLGAMLRCAKGKLSTVIATV